MLAHRDDARLPTGPHIDDRHRVALPIRHEQRPSVRRHGDPGGRCPRRDLPVPGQAALRGQQDEDALGVPIRHVDRAAPRVHADAEGATGQVQRGGHLASVEIDHGQARSIRAGDVGGAAIGREGYAGGGAGDRDLGHDLIRVEIDHVDPVVALRGDEALGAAGGPGQAEPDQKREDKAGGTPASRRDARRHAAYEPFSTLAFRASRPVR